MSSAPTPLTGGCACGAVRYECSSEPLVMFNCHCSECRRASGGAFVTVAVVPQASLTITGSAKAHRTVGDAGRWTDRFFCADCGTL